MTMSRKRYMNWHIVQWSFFLSFSCIATIKSSVHAQEKPNARYQLTQLNYSVSHRQNLCSQYDEVDRGIIPLERSLEGVSIRTGVVLSEYFLLDENGAIAEDYPGLIPVLLDEFCRLAGCTWRNSFAVYDGPAEYNTWTGLLAWSIDVYDVSIDWWASSIDRLANGTAFPEPWHDGSIILVGKTNDDEVTHFDMWAWLDPFDKGVWIMICVSLVLSGLAYLILEYTHHKSDKSIRDGSLIETTFLVAVAFTTHFEFRPTTHATRLFTFSVSFWALLVSASYTANLASFLVVRNQKALQIGSVEDAIRANVPLCIQATSQADVAVTNSFPNINAVRKNEMKDVLLGIHKGECNFAITTVSSWESFKLDKDVNGNCDLDWIGRVFRFVPAGFATKADAGKLCTSLVRDVLNIHLLRMKVDGFIDSAWDGHLLRTATWNCDALAKPGSDEDGEAGQLTLQNLGGVFVFHFMLTALSLLIAFVSRTRRKLKAARKKNAEPGEENVAASASGAMSSEAFPSDLSPSDLMSIKGGASVDKALSEMSRSDLMSSEHNVMDRSESASVAFTFDTKEREGKSVEGSDKCPRRARPTRSSVILLEGARYVGRGLVRGFSKRRKKRFSMDSSSSDFSFSSSDSDQSLEAKLVHEKRMRRKLRARLVKMIDMIDERKETSHDKES